VRRERGRAELARKCAECGRVHGENALLFFFRELFLSLSLFCARVERTFYNELSLSLDTFFLHF
jgi:hypothetical protein